MSFETNPADEMPVDKEEYERWERNRQRARICQNVIDDMEEDACSIDGKPFNGKTVAEQFGKNMAAIQALAKVCKAILEE